MKPTLILQIVLCGASIEAFGIGHEPEPSALIQARVPTIGRCLEQRDGGPLSCSRLGVVQCVGNEIYLNGKPDPTVIAKIRFIMFRDGSVAAQFLRKGHESEFDPIELAECR